MEERVVRTVLFSNGLRLKEICNGGRRAEVALNLHSILRLLLSSTMSAEQRWQRFSRDAAGRRLDRQCRARQNKVGRLR